jgi:ectoine hydroxylase-related dioxygenase (phytanoyl-CoA dioxygenase family)
MDEGHTMSFERHEFNTEFTWQGSRRPLRRVTEEQARSWDELGYFVLEDAVDEAARNRLIAAIDPFERAGEEFLRSRGGRIFIARADEITFTTNLALNSPVVREFVSGPLFQDLCLDLVGPDARLYWDMAVYKKPGTNEPFPWHQDNGYTYVDPQQYVTCWVALTDATPENGCPRVLPGAHRRGTYAHKITPLGFVCTERDPEEAVTVPVKAGSIVVMSSLAPHATGPNLTSAVRKALIAEFIPDGAVSVKREKDGTVVRTPCNTERHLPIVRDGRPAMVAA